jgi:hypothetical protein
MDFKRTLKRRRPSRTRLLRPSELPNCRCIAIPFGLLETLRLSALIESMRGIKKKKPRTPKTETLERTNHETIR